MEPHLLAVKSAFPAFTIDQSDAAAHARALFAGRRDIERMMPIFVNTGIERRYSCVPIDWYQQAHGWKDRTKLYVSNAVDLLEKVAIALLDDVGTATRSLQVSVVTVIDIKLPHAAEVGRLLSPRRGG